MTIIEGADGVTLTSTGMIAFREHADFIDKFFAGESTDSERGFRFVMTLNHEAVHFLQCFTASFPYSFSVSVFELCTQLMDTARQGQLSRKVAMEFRDAFHSRARQFNAEHKGLTTIHLLEAMAVSEAYRATVSQSRKGDHLAFLDFMRTQAPELKSVYRLAFEIVASIHGDSAAYNLTSRLCFLALNSESPPEHFLTMVHSLPRDSGVELSEVPAISLLSSFGIDISQTLLAQIERGLPPAFEHPVFAPFMKELANLGDVHQQYELAARPGDLYSSGTQSTNLVPPLAVFSGGRGRIMGLAQKWSRVELFHYFDATAMIGACFSLMSGQRYYQSCPHTQCDLNKSAICHSWFAKPQNIPWTDCAFPKRFPVQFGATYKDVESVFAL